MRGRWTSAFEHRNFNKASTQQFQTASFIKGRFSGLLFSLPKWNHRNNLQYWGKCLLVKQVYEPRDVKLYSLHKQYFQLRYHSVFPRLTRAKQLLSFQKSGIITLEESDDAVSFLRNSYRSHNEFYTLEACKILVYVTVTHHTLLIICILVSLSLHLVLFSCILH